MQQIDHDKADGSHVPIRHLGVAARIAAELRMRATAHALRLELLGSVIACAWWCCHFAASALHLDSHRLVRELDAPAEPPNRMQCRAMQIP
jgi:hypothetical protein